MKNIAVIILITLVGCNVVEIPPKGIVEGKVTIEPLCGFAQDSVSLAKGKNPCGMTNEEVNAIYGQYSIVLSNAGTNSIPQRKKLDRTGLFSFEAQEGDYNLNLESSIPNAFMFSAKENIEKSVKILSSKTLYYEFSVNTGYPQKK
ncbi:hypothetical protein [Emticicia sp.]|uniref:hypothetical protein n=1 Tax=Emticicia sp. TaxID=1930953 RepID=UPI00375127A2